MPNTNMNTINTRIKLKYDTYANWIKNDPVLLAGEVAIATVENNETNKGATGFQNLPNVVIKVGDGSSNYSALKFVSALAADVHDWAKAADKPKYIASEIEGLEDFIAGEIQDTDTTYEIKPIDESTYKFALYSWAKGEDHATAGTLVSTIDLSAIDTRLDDLETAIGPSGTVAQQITAAIEALDAAKVEAGTTERIVSVEQKDGLVTVTKGDMGIANVAGLQDALDAKQDDLAFDGEYNAATNKVALQSSVTTAINGLTKTETEEANKFVTHMTQANGIVTTVRRGLVEADIPALAQSKITGLEDALAGKQANLAFAGEYNPESNKVALESTVIAAVADLNGAMHFEGVVESDPTKWEVANPDGKYAAGDVVLFEIYEFVFDGTAWHAMGAEGIYELKEDAKAKHDALDKAISDLDAAKQAVLGFEGTYNKETNKVMTRQATADAITTAIEGLDKDDVVVEHKFVTAVSEANGVITVSREQPVVADIAGLEDALDGLSDRIDEKQAIVGFADDYNKDTNKAATVATVTNAINALDNGDVAVDGQFVTAAVQENGVVAVSRANITTDHIHQGAKVLVFDCGTSKF